ncbi:hypothetical protein DH2020_047781 [Rehmannia glutinosa]|uniref:RRM domain-containing protein n=1 Tax=Rehmannia glutinosa TaxID=99300 RepID=A0ABR0U881_REHGL
MAVVENAGANAMTSSNRDVQPNDVAADHHHSQQSTKPAVAAANGQKSTKTADQNYHLTPQNISNGHHQLNGNGVAQEKKMNGDDDDDDGGEGFKREMRDLEEMLSKLNPMAKEFVPPSLASVVGGGNHRMVVAPPSPAAVAAAAAGHFGYNTNGFVFQQLVNSSVPTDNSFRRKKNGYTNGKRRMNTRTSMAQREDVIRRTVYVSDIDHQITEEQLAGLFINCGQVVDCRVCGDPNSVLRFAFVEFTDEEGARNALSLAGTMLGFYPVTQADVKLFFESICGEVNRLRLLGDYHHSTRIAFVEFVMAYVMYVCASLLIMIVSSVVYTLAQSAIAALNCSGAVLGSLPIRVSPSKTPVRPRAPRQSMH